MSQSAAVSLKCPGTWPRRLGFALETIVTVMTNAYMMARISLTVRLAPACDLLMAAHRALAFEKRLGPDKSLERCTRSRDVVVGLRKVIQSATVTRATLCFGISSERMSSFRERSTARSATSVVGR